MRKQPATDALAAKKLGLRRDGLDLTFDSKSLLESLGGVLGILESVIPGTAFAVVYAATQNLIWAIITGSCLALGFIARQIIAGRSLNQALVGVGAMALAVFLALRPGGEAADYFLPGLITNLVYASVLTLSILVRWPLVGILVALASGSGFGWRNQKARMRKYAVVTLYWVVMFATRLIIQVPLYLTSQLAALSIAKVALGLPLYAITIWFSWLTLKSEFKPRS